MDVREEKKRELTGSSASVYVSSCPGAVDIILTFEEAEVDDESRLLLPLRLLLGPLSLVLWPLKRRERRLELLSLSLGLVSGRPSSSSPRFYSSVLSLLLLLCEFPSAYIECS
jgi:hypothetical protein